MARPIHPHAGARCHLLTHGSPDEVAARLSFLAAPFAQVSSSDCWMPQGFDDIEEAQLHNAPRLVDPHMGAAMDVQRAAFRPAHKIEGIAASPLGDWPKARGIEAHVIHASSVAVSREHRRAKTDRLDTELLKRAFVGWLRGEREHCKTAAIPTLREEDAKRPSPASARAWLASRAGLSLGSRRRSCGSAFAASIPSSRRPPRALKPYAAARSAGNSHSLRRRHLRDQPRPALEGDVIP